MRIFSLNPTHESRNRDLLSRGSWREIFSERFQKNVLFRAPEKAERRDCFICGAVHAFNVLRRLDPVLFHTRCGNQSDNSGPASHQKVSSGFSNCHFLRSLRRDRRLSSSGSWTRALLAQRWLIYGVIPAPFGTIKVLPLNLWLRLFPQGASNQSEHLDMHDLSLDVDNYGCEILQ